MLLPGYDPFALAAGCWFDETAAQLAIDFFPACLRHIEGDMAGKPFELEPWQKSFVGNLQGWKRKDSKGRIIRRFREAFGYVPRKNGKTPMIAGIALQMLFTEDEAGQQNYLGAGEREQAGKLFRQARGMVEKEPELSSRCRIYGGNATAGQSRSIVRLDDLSFLQVISADASFQHGGNTHLAVIDELHVLPNRELVDVLKTSMASANRKQPLFVYITTADFDRPSICNEKHAYACAVRDNPGDQAMPGYDPYFLPCIYEAAKDDDWTDPKVWAKANPNLGVSVSREYMERECKQAKEIPAYQNTFRRLHLNQKTEQADRVIDMGQWDACKKAIDLASLAGRSCYAGLDIGATSDFTAFVLLFPHDDLESIEVPADPDNPEAGTREKTRRSFTMLPWFWLPEEPVRRDDRTSALIETWRQLGMIRTTPGNVVDYDLVLEDMIKIVAPYQLVKIGFDRGFQGSQTGNNLMKQFGEEVVNSFAQGILSFNAPFREFLELLGSTRLFHDGNQVLRWMAGNTAAERRGGLIKPSKDKSTEKIDGITAAVMALYMAINFPDDATPSITWV